jgi:hypothetical protein
LEFLACTWLQVCGVIFDNSLPFEAFGILTLEIQLYTTNCTPVGSPRREKIADGQDVEARGVKSSQTDWNSVVEGLSVVLEAYHAGVDAISVLKEVGEQVSDETIKPKMRNLMVSNVKEVAKKRLAT